MRELLWFDHHPFRSQLVVIRSDNARLQCCSSITKSGTDDGKKSSVAASAIQTLDATRSGTCLGKNGSQYPGAICDRRSDSHTYDKAAQNWNHFDIDAALAEPSDDETQVRVSGVLDT